MKIVLAALNAKYIHINLANRSIGKVCKEFAPEICDFTINDNTDNIIAELFEKKADLIAFSCYIWNIEKVLYIAESLKKVSPSLKILLGGHEVSHNAKEILEENPWIDFIIRGEGEIPCRELFVALEKGMPLSLVPSLSFRNDGKIMENPIGKAGSLNDYPFPYDAQIRDFKGKIVYYESSRGCPFCCSYCLSGEGRRVDFLEIERVKKELMFFIENEVPLVKFVDRTFNADKRRANEIWRFIIEHSKKTCFHFELAGSLIDDAAIEILKKAPEGVIQFEIGVQSTNEKTISGIGRNIEFEKVRENVKKLLEPGNIHIHLDLIAGLPYEGYESFGKSFDDVVKVRPHVLQLGFLKMLKGSRLREEADRFGYKYKSKAPYEIMENDFISFDEIIRLKRIEEVFEKYYNSGDFSRSMDFLFEKYPSPFGVFEKIADFFKGKQVFQAPVSLERYYELLSEVFPTEELKDYIRMDRLTNKKAKLSYENEKEFRERCFEFLKKRENVEKYIPDMAELPPRKIYSKVRFERAFGKVYLYEIKSNTIKEIHSDF